MHQWHPQGREARTTYENAMPTFVLQGPGKQRNAVLSVGVSPPNPHQAQHHASERKERENLLWAIGEIL